MLVIPVSSDNIKSPAHEGDVGHDLIASMPPVFSGKPLDGNQEYFSLLRYIEYETSVAVAPPPGVYTLVYPRSSLSQHTNLVLANSVGVIDNGFRNTIKLRFRYIPQPEDYELIDGRIFIRINKDRIYKAGDRVGQAVFHSVLPTEISKQATGTNTSRGLGGFGSTGK